MKKNKLNDLRYPKPVPNKLKKFLNKKNKEKNKKEKIEFSFKEDK